MKINKVVIVGGGSAGWMTAAALCKSFPEMDITLIESKDIKTIGVGESTIQQINSFFDILGLEDNEWMSKCDATYKVSIAFTDFREKGSKFQYPFGKSGGENMPLGHDCWPIIRSINPEENSLEKFAEFYNPNTYLANYNKLTLNEDQSIPNFKFKHDTAYHFDATKFSIYLRDNICKPNGLKYVLEEVVDIVQKENGDVDYITTESGSKFEADLFVDCTGFKSLLLEQKMGSKFISYSDTLLNDRALATKLEYDDPEVEMENVTNCTAIENGWVWNIPMWNRISSGYVYSSKFIDRNQAEVEFKNYLKLKGKEISDSAEILDIEIKHGRHENVWVGNVIGVGLSYGFIEPLESTGLFTTHENIYRLIRILQRRDRHIVGADKTILNLDIKHSMEGLRCFIEMHYGLSLRDDTDYWKHVTSIDYGETADIEQLEINCTRTSNYNGIKGGLVYIAAGMGYLPTYKFGNGYGEITEEDQESFRNVEREYKMFSDSLKSYIESLPSHYEFLKTTIYS